MPVVTGLFFLPVYLLGLFLLHQIPPPSEREVKTRRARVVMDSHMRKTFMKEYWMGIVPLIVSSILSAAYRDYRHLFYFLIFFAYVAIVDQCHG